MGLCEEHIRLSNEVAMVKTKVEGLEDYRDRQNGALQRLAEQVEQIHRWLTSLLGGMVVSLVLLIVNLIVTFGMRR
ncbi:MAG: hypothetical protein QME79_12350 [Bacillota bacterium]|nr:hypothetical protein [Bacillota bacterium]